MRHPQKTTKNSKFSGRLPQLWGFYLQFLAGLDLC